MPLLFVRWSVDALLFQCNLQTWCICPMNRPTPVIEHRLGHMESIAFFHRSISDVVGCSLGHLMFNHASLQGRRDNTSKLILFPEAVRTSDINTSCIDTHTLLSRLSATPPYPAQNNTCIMNQSPSLRNFSNVSGIITFMSNRDNFSHSIFIHE